jgi:Holliday junction DNA helicase RuvA
MIARVNGTLVHKTADSVVIDVNGVGYEVFIPLSTYLRLPAEDAPLALNVHTHLKEDSIQLYGFLTREEKEAFQMLIGVSGVGPKLARNILSGIDVADLASSIAAGDRARLSSIPGIGVKSAERLILELKDKVRNLRAAQSAPARAESRDALSLDVVSALGNMGYRTADAEDALKRARAALAPGYGFEELFKESLRTLSRKR